MNKTPRILIVLIEWRSTKKRVTVRGCWPKDEYKRLPLLESWNLQHAVQVFEGCDHKSHVGFDFTGMNLEALDA